MIEKSEFDVAYETLEDEMYKVSGQSYEEKIQSGKQPELVRPDLLNLKMTIDNNLRGLSRMVYKKLKLKGYL